MADGVPHIHGKHYRYETVENSTNARETRPPSSWELPELQQWLVETAVSVNDNVAIEPFVDLFQQGFDRYG